MEGLRDFSDPQVMLARCLLARRPRATTRRIRSAVGAARRIAQAGRSRDPGLHLGHDRPAEGRDAQPSQHRLPVRRLHASELPLSRTSDDERMGFLPLCHVAERVAGSYYSHRHRRACSISPRARRPCRRTCARSQPTVFGAVPRVWEKFYSGVTIALKDGTPLAQLAPTAWAIGVGYAGRRRALERRSAVPALRRIAFWLARLAGAATTSARSIGLHRARWLVTGAAPISPDLIRWYLALGLDMFEVWGQTENGGLATVDAGRRHQARHRSASRLPLHRS